MALGATNPDPWGKGAVASPSTCERMERATGAIKWSNLRRLRTAISWSIGRYTIDADTRTTSAALMKTWWWKNHWQTNQSQGFEESKIHTDVTGAGVWAGSWTSALISSFSEDHIWMVDRDVPVAIRRIPVSSTT